MATVEQLAHQVASIRAKVGRPEDPKHWIFCLAEGMEIPECIASQMGLYDTSFVERMMPEYFYGMFGTDAVGSCCVITSRGNCIVDMCTGQWTKVMQPVTHARRR